MGLYWNIATLYNWLCWGLTTCQALLVILCRPPIKGRKEIDELVEEMKGGIWEKEEMNIHPVPLPAAKTGGFAQL